jgi:hypothetical protein
MKYRPGRRIILNGRIVEIAHGRHHKDCEPSYLLVNGFWVWQSQLEAGKIV